MKLKLPPLDLGLELVILSGFTLYFYAFLSPIVWFNPSVSLIQFEPYTPPDGYMPFNPCGGIIYRANYTPPATSNKKRYSGTSKERKTWVGYLGTCNRDDDGRTFCTKADLRRPEWNLTYIQANHVIYPASMTSYFKTGPAFASIVFAVLGFLIYEWMCMPYHFSENLAKYKPWNDTTTTILGLALVCCGAVSFFTFATSYLIKYSDLDRFMDVDNFYQPAPCGSQRELKPGVLMRARLGTAWGLLWGAWILCFIPMMVGWLCRVPLRTSTDDLLKRDKKVDTETPHVKDFKAEAMKKDGGAALAPPTYTAVDAHQDNRRQGPESPTVPLPTQAPTYTSKDPFAKVIAKVSIPGQNENKLVTPSFNMPDAHPGTDDDITKQVRYAQKEMTPISQEEKKTVVERTMG